MVKFNEFLFFFFIELPSTMSYSLRLWIKVWWAISLTLNVVLSKNSIFLPAINDKILGIVFLKLPTQLWRDIFIYSITFYNRQCHWFVDIPLLGLYLNKEKDMRYNIKRNKEKEKCQSGGSVFFGVMWENVYTNNNCYHLLHLCLCCSICFVWPRSIPAQL